MLMESSPWDFTMVFSSPSLYQDTAGTGTAVTWHTRWVGWPGCWTMLDWLVVTMGRCSTNKEMFMVLAPPDTEHTYTPESDLSTRIRDNSLPDFTTADSEVENINKKDEETNNLTS